MSKYKKFFWSCGAANPAQAFQCHACSHPFHWEASRPVERALPVRPVSAVTDRSEVELSPGLKILFFFAKLGMAYFDYRKHGQFEWTSPAILFACLLFTLTAPTYVWTILGM